VIDRDELVSTSAAPDTGENPISRELWRTHRYSATKHQQDAVGLVTLTVTALESAETVLVNVQAH